MVLVPGPDSCAAKATTLNWWTRSARKSWSASATLDWSTTPTSFRRLPLPANRQPFRAPSRRPKRKMSMHRLIVDGELILYGLVGEVWDMECFTPREVLDALVFLKGDFTCRLNSG